MKRLVIRGASQNNLKNIDIEIDLGSICAFCGPSGAGKSSLVFDTIYSEAQRRFIETFSPYARQFLERLPRAKVKRIENLPAAISVGQTNPVKNSRSTVATLSDISFPARMLFFRNSTPFCTRCDLPLRPSTWQDVFSCLKEAAKSGAKKGYICIGADEQEVAGLLKQGYGRILVSGNIIDTAEEPGILSSGQEEYSVIVERLALSSLLPERVKEAVETAFGLSEKAIHVFVEKEESPRTFYKRPVCPQCGREKREPGMLLFSFNSPEGACPECRGFGRVMDIDWDLVIPDKSLSLEQGAVRPLENWSEERQFLFSCCSKWGLDISKPWSRLSRQEHEAVIFGRDEWYGIKGIFDWLESKRYKAHIRILLSRYRAFNTCPKCKGARFNQEALSYRIFGTDIANFYALSVKEAIKWCRKLPHNLHLDKASMSLLEDLTRRLCLIDKAGLGYLGLDRQSRTLSGGELSRLCLAKGVSVSLSDTLYCLDEPSSGLHPEDAHGVQEVIRDLRKAGNTVLMKEGDSGMVQCADRVVHLGPGSGREGGRIVKDGAPEMVQPLTVGDAGDLSRQVRKPGSFVEIRGLRQNNLKDISIRIPLESLTCVCGVSGSGKSTLVEECLYRGLLRKMGKPSASPGMFRELVVPQGFDQVVFVDQEPASRTPRGCPGTYLKILDPIRRLFSRTKEARALGLGPGFFSLNVDGGRCELCKGQGYELLDMQFLPDVMVKCSYCKGARFSKEALEIEYRGKNISQILEMTLSEVLAFFEGEKGVEECLEPAIGLGLGHLLLGQPLNTLSAGDSQRLKIAKHLGLSKGRGLFILDEPTRGLYQDEVRGLIRQLRGLCAKGNTVVVVEHDLSTILSADWVIELGPGGGEKGGRLLYQGRPGGLLERKTPTSRAIRRGQGKEGKRQQHQGKSVPVDAAKDVIEIKGARHHNLKDIDIEIPRKRLVVVTGVSGSGKSSLAFDLVFKEAQRRYLESLPSYMKQFIRIHERPEVDVIRGLSPSIAVEQRACRAGSMSTVATLSETSHFLRLLFTHFSNPVCPECKGPMRQATSHEVEQGIKALLNEGPLYIGAPRIRHRKGWHQAEIERGFSRGADLVLADDRFVEKGGKVSLSRYKEHSISWLWGPFEQGRSLKRLEKALKDALRAGNGTLFCLGKERAGKKSWFSLKYFCRDCQTSVSEPDPLLFSFHTKTGRCPECKGSGRTSSLATCPLCKGTRLSDKALSWKIDGYDIASFMALEVDEALTLLERWQKKRDKYGQRGALFAMLTGQVMERLKLMSELGLGYLCLDRSGDSLSGGEAQRISLSSQGASDLTGVTFVLDEPTIGLHPSDNRRLVRSLKRLSRRGNSVIVVEHDEETILSSDFVIDLGPGGGREGGHVQYAGSVEGLLSHSESKTAQGLRNRKVLVEKSKRLKDDTDFLFVNGVRRHNLLNVDVKIPLGAVTVVTGVSGSGKTSLKEALFSALSGDLTHVDRLRGGEGIKSVLHIDHSPIGRTPRSCPATFIGILSHIRHLFSRTPAARIRGLGPSHFSFNTKEGACPSCKGQGQLRQSLGILPDVYVKCPVCTGKRFKKEVLSIKWKSKDMSQVLEMTVSEALEFFSAIPQIRRGLKVMEDLGLGYLCLGQPSPSLSGGEAQRLKIAKELSKAQDRSRLYLLDEPSVGLHMEDVARLSRCLSRLSGLGNTVLIVEHNLSVVSRADWIIDLGPGGGKHGGRVLYQGALFDFLGSDTASKTLECLRQVAIRG